jgi:peptidoglycan/LPS O-acetylase OafA/YrhL
MIGRRLTQIQLLRAVAAFLVMASHLASIDRKYSVDPVTPAWLDVGMTGVDLFFVISGFIMTLLAADARRGPGATAAFLFSRAGRIYPLYWVVATVVTVLWFYRPEMVFSSDPSPPDLVKSFLLWPESRLPLLAVAWTLIHEMYFYLVFAILLLLPRNWLLPGLIAWGGIVVLGQGLGWSSAGPEARLAVHALTFEFIAGALAGMAFLRWRGRLGALAVTVGGAGFVCTAAFVAASGLFREDPFWTSSWLRPLLFAAPAALLTYGLAAMDERGRPAPRIASALGDQSYALYLTHILSLSAAGRIWAMLPQSTAPWDNVLALAAATLATYLAAEIAYRLIDRPAHRTVQALRRAFNRERTSSRAVSSPAP